MFSDSRGNNHGHSQSAVAVFEDFDAFNRSHGDTSEVDEQSSEGGGREHQVNRSCAGPTGTFTLVSDAESSLLGDYISLMGEKSFDEFNYTLEGEQKAASISCNDDDLSISSINTKGINLINDLKKRLRTQESAKAELLNLCLQLERKLDNCERRIKSNNSIASEQEFKTENFKLRQKNAEMENDFMNAMNDLVMKMAMKEEKYNESLLWREQKIRFLEAELNLFSRLLAVKKSLDDASTIGTISGFSCSLNSEYSEKLVEGSKKVVRKRSNINPYTLTKEPAPAVPREVVISNNIM